MWNNQSINSLLIYVCGIIFALLSFCRLNWKTPTPLTLSMFQPTYLASKIGGSQFHISTKKNPSNQAKY